MKEYIDFIYDGVSSEDVGVIQAYRDGGLFDEDFISGREIIEEKVRGNDSPYFFDVERRPLEFNLGLYFSDDLSPVDKRKIARFLDKDSYKPLIFKDNPDQIYYCMPASDISLTHNGSNKGFIELVMRCNSPYSYSPVYLSSEYQFGGNDSDEEDEDIILLGNEDNPDREITFVNNGDKDCKPIIHIEKIGSGDISIKGYYKDQEVKVNNLSDGENIVINGIMESIESDIPLVYRYDDFNNKYLSLPVGESTISVEGDFRMVLEYSFVFIHDSR